VPGFARAHCHGDGTPVRPGASGRKAAPGVPPGVSGYRTWPLVCGHQSSAVSGSRSRLAAHAGPCARYGVNRDTLARPRLERPAGRRVGRCGAQSEYIPVRSVAYDRAEFSRAQQVAVTGPQVPQANTGRTVWPATQMPVEHRREKADVTTRLPIGWSSVLGGGRRRGAGTRGSRRREPARRGHRRTASRSAWSPAGCVSAHTLGNGEQPAASAYAASSLLPRNRPVPDADASAKAPTSQP